ncbi:ferric reductase like transmembrane component-domain-containing protein [Tuber borchii]|uniref:ferric-chelate reductase (NADPH) n=1 Tax=Tuber borchii TaxID=42251 RepID=A0A2T6ZBW8_TUBBO|nr:ferric reductase like transmembrane component-domain-containing protein [Tuber borchii]
MMGSTTMLVWVMFGGLAFGAQPSVHLTPAQIAVERAAETAASRENSDFSKWMILSLAAFAVLPLFYRFCSVIYSRIRLLVSLGRENQRFFAASPSAWASFIKKHVIYSPLFRVRHNREFQLSTAVNVGTLPTRFQTFFLIGYLAGNIVFCTFMIDYAADSTSMLGEVRNRTGVLSVVNMVPLFLLAGRNNPLIQLLGISFDTYNLIHRWLGRIVVLEAVTHTACWMTAKVMSSGWEVVAKSIKTSPFIQFGFIAVVCFVFLMLHSPSALRHAFYETFLVLHIIAAALAVTGVYHHLAIKGYTWLRYVKVVIALWAFDRGLRLLRVLYRNVGRKMTTATCEALPGDAIRVTLHIARPWTFRPGQHLYLYMPTLALWTSHPFTISWSENEKYVKYDPEKLSLHRQDIVHTGQSTLSLIIRRRTGFTNALYKKAYDAPERIFTTRALVEGPYGKIDTLGSYGTVVLIAGGVGITHPVPYVRELVDGYAQGTVATRRITLVWAIQSPEHLEWIRPWMTDILAMEKRREVLKVLLFVTRPKSTREIHSPSATVQMFPGRPNIDTLLDMEIDHKMGKMAVMVCGSGSLSDDVRRAVRNKTPKANIDFMEEAFSW